MPASEARIQANRLNAQKSTGPRTEEGKAASRANALKHGLTGSGVVASEEDADAVARLSAELRGEMRPSGALGRILVGRIAVQAVRLERCARQESAALSEKVRNAEADFDERREAEADDLFEHLGAAPAAHVRKLRRTPEGIARLVRGWLDLAGALRQPGAEPWGEAQLRAFEDLSGRPLGEFPPSRATALTRLLALDDRSGLPPAEVSHLLDAPSRQAWARDRLSDLISEQVDALEAADRDLDLEAIDQDRAEAPARALFDTSKEATLARKYEAAAERGLYRALGEFRLAEAEAAALAAEAPPSAESARGSLASFFRDTARPIGLDQPDRDARPGHVARPEARPEAAGIDQVAGSPGGSR